jgi:hypothetical protein
MRPTNIEINLHSMRQRVSRYQVPQKIKIILNFICSCEIFSLYFFLKWKEILEIIQECYSQSWNLLHFLDAQDKFHMVITNYVASLYLDMLHTIFISKDPIGNTLASSTISTFLTITCNRGSNPHPDLIFKENIIQSK